MKNIFNHKSNREGFTLIELLVVVAIISLLSSIVLATLKDARDKAKQKVFRQEIMQLVNALELYRSDNGKYPYEDEIYSYGVKQNGEGDTTVGKTDLLILLQNYIEVLPKPINFNSISGGFVWSYQTNVIDESNSEPNTRCSNTDSYFLPKYTIIVTNADETAIKGVQDWANTVYMYDLAFGELSRFEVPSNNKCFSVN